MDDQFYTVEKVAEILGMHHKTIRKFIREGKLGANKVGKQWRISGHDLSVFMEKNNVNIGEKNTSDESKLDYSNEATECSIKNKISVSTVVDIKDIDKEQYDRVSNFLLALMNCKDSKMGKATINMKYNNKEKRLRVMLWGSIKFIEDMLSSISMVIEEDDL